MLLTYYRPRSKGDDTFGSVCPLVCVFVYALTSEPFDLRPWFLAWGSTSTLARLGVKVGQSQTVKMSFDMVFYCLLPYFEVKVNPRGQSQSSMTRSNVWCVAVDIWVGFLSAAKASGHMEYTKRVLTCVPQTCWVLQKITMTHEIQSKISVCLSVLRKRSRSRAARSGQGLLQCMCALSYVKLSYLFLVDCQ